MKKWIILTAMAILFLYPVISLTQMAFQGSFDLLLLIKNAVYSMFCMVLYLYFLWTVSSKYPVVSWSIFVVVMILVISHDFARETEPFKESIKIISEIGLTRLIFEFLYLAFSLVVAFVEGLEIREKRNLRA